MASLPPLYVDESRIDLPETGIPVRAAILGAEYLSYDLVHLDTASLKAWLKSRGGTNEWAEETVMILLGHCYHYDHPDRTISNK